MAKQFNLSQQLTHNLTTVSSIPTPPNLITKIDACTHPREAHISYSKKQSKIAKDFQGIHIADFDEMFDDSSFNEDSQSEQENTAEKYFNYQGSSSNDSTNSDGNYLDYSENLNCPICGINIPLGHDSTPLLVKSIRRTFLFHNDCYKTLPLEKIQNLKNAGQSVQGSLIFQQSHRVLQLNEALHFSHFFAELIICHPLNNIVYLQTQKKIAIENNLLKWNLQSENSNNLEPNVLCIPYLDFKLRLIIQIAALTFTYEFNLNLNHLDRKHKLRRFEAFAAAPQEIYLQGQIIQSFEQRKALINKMNYKYHYSPQSEPMVKFNSLSFKISKVQQTKLYSIQNFLLQSQNQNLNACQVISNYSENSGYSSEFQGYDYPNSVPYYYDNPYNQYPYQNIPNLQNLKNLQYPNVQYQPEYQDYHQQQQRPQIPLQKYQISSSRQQYEQILPDHHYEIAQHSSINNEKVDDEYLPIYEAIRQKKIEQYVSTNNGSRHAQKFLKKCSQEELDIFIDAAYNILEKLVICPYGNYTFQQLINACLPQKKRSLIAKLGPHIPEVAKTKQGTHALQTLIKTITLESQIELIKINIESQILPLSKDAHATHFIQKVVKTFGDINYKYIEFIYLNVLYNLLEYAQDSNGILVIKVLMAQIKDIQLMSNKLIQQIQVNLETIIQDPYGNYIVQQAYDQFKQARVKPITNKIMQKFIAYSINKYASNVIINCLQVHCTHEFFKAAESVFMKCKKFDDISKSVSGLHIIKLLFQSSQNKIFIEDVRTLFKEKLPKLTWLECNTPRNERKEAQTVKVDNKSNFNIAVVENVLEKDSNFSKKKSNLNGSSSGKNASTFTPNFKKTESKPSTNKKIQQS